MFYVSFERSELEHKSKLQLKLDRGWNALFILMLWPHYWKKKLHSVEFEFIVVLRHMQRYFSHICDGTDVQADWRRSCTYGRAPNAIDIS